MLYVGWVFQDIISWSGPEFTILQIPINFHILTGAIYFEEKSSREAFLKSSQFEVPDAGGVSLTPKKALGAIAGAAKGAAAATTTTTTTQRQDKRKQQSKDKERKEQKSSKNGKEKRGTDDVTKNKPSKGEDEEEDKGAEEKKGAEDEKEEEEEDEKAKKAKKAENEENDEAIDEDYDDCSISGKKNYRSDVPVGISVLIQYGD